MYCICLAFPSVCVYMMCAAQYEKLQLAKRRAEVIGERERVTKSVRGRERGGGWNGVNKFFPETAVKALTTHYSNSSSK